jgi:DNA repair exonuclease SbcCD ATPase subunit
MTLKEFLSKTKSKTTSWLRAHNPAPPPGYQPEVNDQGLINPEPESTQAPAEEKREPSDKVVVKAVQPADKRESLEKLQEGFNKLITQLEGINEHLSCQAAQHDDLMGRIEQLPELLQSFPTMIENQRNIVEQMLEQLKASAMKNEQFVDAVGKIPAETAKQTDALVNIDHQLAAAADLDVQRAQSFNRFNETLDKLNQSTLGQTDSIMQMSKTFATSDRYLKYLMSRQNKRFMWVFVIAIGVCTLAILVLAGIVIYLRH